MSKDSGCSIRREPNDLRVRMVVQSPLPIQSCVKIGRRHDMKTRIATRLVLITLSALTLCAAACETVKGAGKDIQYAGEKTQDALEKAGAPK